MNNVDATNGDFSMTLRIPKLIAVSLWASLVATMLAEAGSSLVVNPPAGHSVEKDTLDPGYTQAFSVSSKLDSNAGCSAAFMPIDGSGATQAMLNKGAALPLYRASVEHFLGAKFDITGVEAYRLGDIQGVRAMGHAKADASVGLLATVLDTPKGRTNIVCIGPSASMGKLRPEFEAITRGVVPPS